MSEVEILVKKLKKDLTEAKKDPTIKDLSAKSWGFEEGYLLSYSEIEMLLNYIKFLRMASGR